MFAKKIDKWIDKRLEKDGFIRVPSSWKEDYKNLVEKHQGTSRVLREIAREYNTLLKEFAEEKSINWLKNTLKEIGIECKSVHDKEDLVNLYVEAYAVNFEDDTEEEVK